MRDLNNYIDRAIACLRGIEKIKEEINKCDSSEKRAEVADKFADDLATLSRACKECLNAIERGLL